MGWDTRALVILLATAMLGVSGASRRLRAQEPQVPQVDRTVAPQTFLSANLADPLRFAAALARDGVPAGFVIASQAAVANDLPAIPIEPPPSSELRSNAVQVFVNTHPEYTARHSGAALVIRPRARTVCDAALQRRLAGAMITAPAYELFWRLARSVNPSRVPSAPPGVMCGGNCGAATERHHLSNLTMAFDGVRLEEALSQIVVNAPGLVWVLREQWSDERGEWACALEYFDGASHVATSYVLASAPTR